MKTIEKLDEETLLVTDGGLKYVQFESLLRYEDILTHCFTTRIGGASSGECSSLNFGFNRNDSRENVMENFHRICSAINLDCSSIVFSNQVHDNKIGFVTSNESGRGFKVWSDITDEESISLVRDIPGYDGIVTTEKGVTLVTFFADCVPVLLFDRNGRAIANVHSGWRSTLKGITYEAVKTLQSIAGIDPKDLICVIGPSIGKCCFEVDEDVYLEFKVRFSDDRFYKDFGNNKKKIDLREIIKTNAVEAGILAASIHTSSICTKCRKDLFFSYRGDCGKTGSLAAFMHLKKVQGSSL